MSKKQYEMSIAFFLLANKIPDAVDIAIDRMKDLNLGLLILRLFETDQGELTKRFINEQLIQNGKMADDPYLVHIGYWWLGEHFESINQVGTMVEDAKQKMSSRVFE